MTGQTRPCQPLGETMARPRKFYVIFEHGKAIDIVEGLPDRRLSFAAFPTRLQAEEFYCWWNHAQRH